MCTFKTDGIVDCPENKFESDWTEVKRIFRYLRGTSELGLTFRAKGEKLEAYSDGSYKDYEDGSSTGGYVVKLFEDTIGWRSHKQRVKSTSTCQAETIAMSDVCAELVLLDKGIRDMIGITMYPISVRCDNKSTVDRSQMDGSNKLNILMPKLKK